MHLTILRMISTGSLAAFSANIAQGGVGAGTQAGPVSRATGVPPQRDTSTRSPPAVPSLGGPNTTQPPTRPLPRGSLLDLTI